MKPNDSAVSRRCRRSTTARVNSTRRFNALNERAQHGRTTPKPTRHLDVLLERAYKNFKLTEADKRKYIQAGIEEADKALALKPDYFEAADYKKTAAAVYGAVEGTGRQQPLLKQADHAPRQGQETAEAEAGPTTAPTKSRRRS